MLYVLILYMCGGIYSLMSTLNDRFSWETFYGNFLLPLWCFLFYQKKMCILLKKNVHFIKKKCAFYLKKKNLRFI